MYTGMVQAKFEKICQVRLKDIVSKAGCKRKQPKWIKDTLWAEMCAYWDTEDAKARHDSASAARLSDRKGKGPHKHVSGQKSFLQVEQELEVELGRPPTVFEVFVKTHTKKNGTLVDNKAQEVYDTYKKKKEAKLAELYYDESADGTSRRAELSLEEDNEIFFESTTTNERGQVFGIGSLGTYINGKRNYPGSSSCLTTVQQQLDEANKRIQDQAALQLQREADYKRDTDALKLEIKGLSAVKKFLSLKDPDFLPFLTAEEDPDT